VAQVATVGRDTTGALTVTVALEVTPDGMVHRGPAWDGLAERTGLAGRVSPVGWVGPEGRPQVGADVEREAPRDGPGGAECGGGHSGELADRQVVPGAESCVDDDTSYVPRVRPPSSWQVGGVSPVLAQSGARSAPRLGAGHRGTGRAGTGSVSWVRSAGGMS
jgi:hypothetical protein